MPNSMRPVMGIARKQVVKCTALEVKVRQDELCVEEHLLIFVAGVYLGRTIHTPGCAQGQDVDLAYGFAFVEGAVRTADDVARVDFSTPRAGLKRADITLTAQGERWWRYASTREPWHGVDMVGRQVSGKAPDWKVTPDQLNAMMRDMESNQVIFPRTGGAHCSALFTLAGERLAQAEDIGRHNALDKVIGGALRTGQLVRADIGVMSSRLSWELVRKAEAAGLVLLAGISAATSLAVEAAAECGITLVGRLRGGSMIVYSHPERLLVEEAADVCQAGWLAGAEAEDGRLAPLAFIPRNG